MIDILNRFEELHTALSSLPIPAIRQAIARVEEARSQRQTVFIVGNGGSAALASHLANDLNKLASANQLVRFRALALADSVPLLTAVANDNSYSSTFLYPFINFAESGDVLLALSTSGQSENILTVATEARSRNITVIGIVGMPGSELAKMADIAIITNAPTQTEQEDMMSIVCHTIAEALRTPEPFTIPSYFAEALR